MSKIALEGNASGIGTFTISAPNGNTDRTLVLPDEAGTVLTTAGVPASAMPAGSVLQILTGVAYPGAGVTTASTSFVDTGIIEIAITPAEANSKILAYFSGFCTHINPAADNWGGALHIYRSVAGGAYSPVNGNTTTGLWGTYKHNQYSDAWDDRVATLQYLDSPSYTVGQEIKYRVFFKKSTRGSGGFYGHHTGGVGSYAGNVAVVGVVQEHKA